MPSVQTVQKSTERCIGIWTILTITLPSLVTIIHLKFMMNELPEYELSYNLYPGNERACLNANSNFED